MFPLNVIARSHTCFRRQLWDFSPGRFATAEEDAVPRHEAIPQSLLGAWMKMSSLEL